MWASVEPSLDVEPSHDAEPSLDVELFSWYGAFHIMPSLSNHMEPFLWYYTESCIILLYIWFTYFIYKSSTYEIIKISVYFAHEVGLVLTRKQMQTIQ